MRCVPLVVSCCLAALGAAPAVRAETQAFPRAGSDKVAAEALFREGRKLMGEARYAEACAKFEASQRLDPGVGTMLNLAECYEKTGRTASAWAEFREVISAAREADSKEREELARRRAEALEAKLSRLTITLSTEASQIRGIEVRRDGALLDGAEFGSAIPVDPGKHTIEATAPGRAKWFRTLEVGAEGQQESVVIPELPPAEEARVTAPRQASAEPEPAPSGGRSHKGVAIALGAVGVAGLGVGTYFGLKAASDWSDAKSKCQSFPNQCGPESVELADDARGGALVANIAFGVGLLGVASGAVLWFLGDSSGDASSAARGTIQVRRPSGVTARVSVGPGSMQVRGTF